MKLMESEKKEKFLFQPRRGEKSLKLKGSIEGRVSGYNRPLTPVWTEENFWPCRYMPGDLIVSS